MIQIFLSHSSKDHRLVEPIHAQAHAIDVEVYLHELHSEPGVVMSIKIKEAIKASHALVVLITPNTVPSPYVNQEIGFALGQGLPVIPLVAAGVSSEHLAMLEGAEYIEFDPDQPQDALTKLTSHLHGRQVKQTTALQAQQLAALRRQQDLTIALGFVCVVLILYIATKSGALGRP
jgi:hypothetical protein